VTRRTSTSWLSGSTSFSQDEADVLQRASAGFSQLRDWRAEPSQATVTAVQRTSARANHADLNTCSPASRRNCAVVCVMRCVHHHHANAVVEGAVHFNIVNARCFFAVG
jgi:hypothetical protein